MGSTATPPIISGTLAILHFLQYSSVPAITDESRTGIIFAPHTGQWYHPSITTGVTAFLRELPFGFGKQLVKALLLGLLALLEGAAELLFGLF